MCKLPWLSSYTSFKLFLIFSFVNISYYKLFLTWRKLP
jgi:hypothetical protein